MYAVEMKPLEATLILNHIIALGSGDLGNREIFCDLDHLSRDLVSLA
jgi:hypothetical protein